MRNRIPKRVIQIRCGKLVPTQMNRAATANIRLMNPDYEYILFDDSRVEALLKDQFPQYREIFDSFRFPIQRYDFFRYLAVFHYGGFYFDLDVLLSSDLSRLLEFECVFPFERLTYSHFRRNQYNMDWDIGNYAFGAAPGHPFLKAVIDNCVRAHENPDWVTPMLRGSPPFIKDELFIVNSTGPGLVSRTWAENAELAKSVTILFPDDVCDVRTWDQFGDFGVHLADSSWRTDKNYFRGKLTEYGRRWIVRRVVKNGIRLGKTRAPVSQILPK